MTDEENSLFQKGSSEFLVGKKLEKLADSEEKACDGIYGIIYLSFEKRRFHYG